MYPLDWILVLYAVYVPLLIGLYVVELIVIFRHRKSATFNSSFYRVFSILAVVNIAACLEGTFVYRLPLFPMVSGLFDEINGTSPWLTAAYSLAYYLNCLSEFLGVFLAFNRFTALFFPTLHGKFWRWALFIGVFLCVAISFAPTYQLMDNKTMFMRLYGSMSEHGWYYLLSSGDRAETVTKPSIFLNMCVVTVVCNGLSSLLYAACIYRLCFLSAKRNFVIERNFFLVGFLTLIFSLPYCAAMVYFYIIFTFYIEGVNMDQLGSVVFQLPWLTDLKQIFGASANASSLKFGSSFNQGDDTPLLPFHGIPTKQYSFPNLPH